MDLGINTFRIRADKLQTFNSINGKTKNVSIVSEPPTPTPPADLLLFVNTTSYPPEGGFGENGDSQINLFVPEQPDGESDYLYFYNSTYDTTSTEYVTMVVYIDSFPRAVVNFTLDRLGTNFWYKMFETEEQLIQGTFEDGEAYLFTA